MRIAVVHEWFSRWAGSEQVLEQILQVLPQAELIALTHRPDAEGVRRLAGRPVKTSFIQRLPLGARAPQLYLPWLPWAAESLPLRDYDLVICNHHCVAKGVIARPDAVQVAYVHSPMRYAWDLAAEYERQIAWPLRPLWSRTMHGLRQWDTASAARLDALACNSGYIAGRINRAWRRPAEVVYPPVDVGTFVPRACTRRGFVTASRLVGYKQVPLIVAAFATMPGLPLTVIGDGPDLAACRRIADGAANITFRGHVPRAELVAEVQQAEAFVFAAEEDFGIAPVEAMACGTPVIAFGRGGAAESVLDGRTGLHFHAQTPEAIREAVRRFKDGPGIPAEACVARAAEFSQAVFRRRFAAWLRQALAGRALPPGLEEH